jgi:hypothetical protein
LITRQWILVRVNVPQAYSQCDDPVADVAAVVAVAASAAAEVAASIPPVNSAIGVAIARMRRIIGLLAWLFERNALSSR